MTDLNRVFDPGRGEFCATTKSGHALPFPPAKRTPLVNRDTNPRGVMRPGKTRDDSLPVAQRARVIAAQQRLAKAQR
jgi:hypothetical protein